MKKIRNWGIQCICISALIFFVTSVMMFIYCISLKALSVLAPLLAIGEEASILSLAVLLCCILVYVAFYIADVVGERNGMLDILGMVGLAGFCYCLVIAFVAWHAVSIICPTCLIYLLLMGVFNYRATIKRDL